MWKALYGTNDAAFKGAGYYMHKAGIKMKGVDGSANDEQLDEERHTFTKDGEKVVGFASSVVPTLEEKTIAEHRPPKEQANGHRPVMDAVDEDNKVSVNGGPEEARVHDESQELYGAPAGAAGGTQNDDAPPRGRTTNTRASEEDAAVDARRVIRNHLASKFGNKPWTLPTPTPEIDPNGFKDPICDKFWKNVWVACAVHNVSFLLSPTSYSLA